MKHAVFDGAPAGAEKGRAIGTEKNAPEVQSRFALRFWRIPYMALLSLLLTALAAVHLLLLPQVVLSADGARLLSLPARDGMPLSIRFIHSVQKTPVEENLAVEKDGFVLHSTRYYSFGVGLPFLASDGDFYMEDGAWVMDHMERRFPSLSLRTGVGAKLCVTVDGKTLELYKKYPPGTRIDIVRVPLYQWIFS